MNEFYVKKANGTLQPFAVDKLKRSLLFTGASESQIEPILEYISAKAHNGMTTKTIYNMAFKKLRKIARPMSAYYGTKKSLLELGPDGFYFERFIARMLSRLGYETRVSEWVDGHCISHEVDVIAEKDGKAVLIECKFHNQAERHNDLKTVLYIKARANDILESEFGAQYSDFWLVSNTSFSDDSITYATCAGLRLWGANFPPQNTLQDTIRDHGLDSLTCISNLKKKEKRMLLDSDIFLAVELEENPSLLKDVGVEKKRIERILDEIGKITNRGTP